MNRGSGQLVRLRAAQPDTHPSSMDFSLSHRMPDLVARAGVMAVQVDLKAVAFTAFESWWSSHMCYCLATGHASFHVDSYTCVLAAKRAGKVRV